MKCVQDKSTMEIRRVKENEASKLINDGTHHYINKESWKFFRKPVNNDKKAWGRGEELFVKNTFEKCQGTQVKKAEFVSRCTGRSVSAVTNKWKSERDK